MNPVIWLFAGLEIAEIVEITRQLVSLGFEGKLKDK
jgi:hypothetical protein